MAAGWITGILGLGFEAYASGTSGFLGLMAGAAILAFLNATLGNLLKLLTIPLRCLTLGIFTLVINAVVLMIAASFEFGFRFTTESGSKFLAAFVAAILIAAVNGVLSGILIRDGSDDEE